LITNSEVNWITDEAIAPRITSSRSRSFRHIQVIVRSKEQVLSAVRLRSAAPSFGTNDLIQQGPVALVEESGDLGGCLTDGERASVVGMLLILQQGKFMQVACSPSHRSIE
jgi:hypothetical protein